MAPHGTYKYTHICMHIYIYAYMYNIYVCIYMYICTTYIHMKNVRARGAVQSGTSWHIYTHICMYKYMYIYMYNVYICIYIYIYRERERERERETHTDTHREIRTHKCTHTNWTCPLFKHAPPSRRRHQRAADVLREQVLKREGRGGGKEREEAKKEEGRERGSVRVCVKELQECVADILKERKRHGETNKDLKYKESTRKKVEESKVRVKKHNERKDREGERKCEIVIRTNRWTQIICMYI